MTNPNSFVLLVDYDNVRPASKETTADALETNLRLLSGALATQLAPLNPGSACEVEMRLYGGWLSERGTYTQRGDWMLRRLHAARGLYAGARITPKLVLSIAERADCDLQGTCRDRYGKPVQKMVDSMMCVDILHFAQLSRPLVVASDDDDLVPALISASTKSTSRLRVLRHREADSAINDHHLKMCGVAVESLPLQLRRSHEHQR